MQRVVTAAVAMAMLALAAGAAAAADADLTPFRFESGGQADISLKGGWSTFPGGVKISYQKALIACDTLRFKQSPLADGKQDVLDQFELLPGPASLVPDRVLLDNSAADGPDTRFRGRLTPRRIVAARLPEAAGDKQVRFHVDLDDLGSFAAEVHDPKEGWLPYIGWADHAQVALIADVGPNGLTRYRVEAVHFFGAEGETGQPFRQARMALLAHAVADPAIILKPRDPALEIGRVSDNSISMLFDPNGDEHVQFGVHMASEGDLQAVVRRLQRSSRPKRE